MTAIGTGTQSMGCRRLGLDPQLAKIPVYVVEAFTQKKSPLPQEILPELRKSTLRNGVERETGIEPATFSLGR